MEKEIEMLDALFRYATEGIIISDKEGIIRMINPIAEIQFGYSKDELINQNIDVLVPGRFGRHQSHRQGYVQNPHARSMGIGMDLYAKRKDGTEFPVEISLSPFSTSEGMFIMSFIIDISLRKKHEADISKANEEIKALNASLEKRVAERTEDLARVVKELAESKQEVMRALEKEKELNTLKSRFITIASHEFRTPLAAILSSVSLLSQYNTPEHLEKHKKHVQRIKSSVKNLIEILNDFLSLSKLEEGAVRNNPVEMNLQEFSKETVEEIKTTAKENQEIMYQHTGKADTVAFDHQLMKNVMINLLSNAIKYSPPHSIIHFNSNYTDDCVKITVSDCGIGIPDEDQVHLFERFFRANNVSNIEGTGLGLNIVKKYVELMGGEISFSSKVNEGTTFIVTLPTTQHKNDQNYFTD